MSTIIDSLEELHLGQGLLIRMLDFSRNHSLSEHLCIKYVISSRNTGRGKDFLSKSRIPFDNIAKSVALLPWAKVPGVRILAWCSAALSGSRSFAGMIGQGPQLASRPIDLTSRAGGPKQSPLFYMRRDLHSSGLNNLELSGEPTLKYMLATYW